MKACTPLTSPRGSCRSWDCYTHSDRSPWLTSAGISRRGTTNCGLYSIFFVSSPRKLRQESLEVSLKQLPTRICRLLFHLFILLFQPLRPPGSWDWGMTFHTQIFIVDVHANPHIVWQRLSAIFTRTPLLNLTRSVHFPECGKNPPSHRFLRRSSRPQFNR